MSLFDWEKNQVSHLLMWCMTRALLWKLMINGFGKSVSLLELSIKSAYDILRGELNGDRVRLFKVFLED